MWPGYVASFPGQGCVDWLCSLVLRPGVCGLGMLPRSQAKGVWPGYVASFPGQGCVAWVCSLVPRPGVCGLVM